MMQLPRELEVFRLEQALPSLDRNFTGFTGCDDL
jgi:hypothetical protein